MVRDLKFAWRRLLHAPGFALVAVLTLAVGVGANAAILSVADGILFRPLPFDTPDRLFLLQMNDQATGKRYTNVSYSYLDAIRNPQTGLGAVGIFESGTSALQDTPDGVDVVQTMRATMSYFNVLGVRPAFGRLFTSQDSPGRSALLSYSTWRKRFGSDRTITGHSITIGTTTFDIVGILPPDFVIPTTTFFSGRPELVTLLADPAPGATGGTFHPVVRLPEGMTREQAQARLDAIGAAVAAGDPKRASQAPFLEDIRERMYPVGRPVMRLLVTAAVLVLFIGCANLANMLLARGRGREREMAMRTALGASRLQLVRPMLFEALIIGVLGSLLALAVTTLSFDSLLRQVPDAALGNAPRGVDVRIALLSLTLGLAGGLIFGVIPAWLAGRSDVLTLLNARHRGQAARARLGRPMVAVQVALAVVLVFGAVVAARAFVAVTIRPTGFDPVNVIAVYVTPARTVTDRAGFYRSVLETVAARPDVLAAGGSSSPPMTGNAPWSGIKAPGSQTMVAGIVQCTPGYLDAIGVRLIRGRALTWSDAGTPDALFSEAAVKTLLPGEVEPLGKTIDDGQGQTLRVAGIVADVPTLGFTQPPVYALAFGPTGAMSTYVRVRGHRAELLTEIKRQVSAIAPGRPVSAAWWSDNISAQTTYRNPRFQAIVLSAFATIAVGLTALGIFGVVAFLVASRTREMGIRVAIGADPSSLVSLVVRDAILPVAAGLFVGLVATRWAAKLAEAQLFKVDTHSPITLVVAAISVIAAAAIAAYIPARRAARVDPMVALRAE